MLAIVEYGHIWAGQAAVGSKTRRDRRSSWACCDAVAGRCVLRCSASLLLVVGGHSAAGRQANSARSRLVAAAAHAVVFDVVHGGWADAGIGWPNAGAVGWACSSAVRSAA